MDKEAILTLAIIILGGLDLLGFFFLIDVSNDLNQKNVYISLLEDQISALMNKGKRNIEILAKVIDTDDPDVKYIETDEIRLIIREGELVGWYRPGEADV